MKVHASFTIWMEAKPLLALKEKGKQREVMKAGRKWKAKEKVQIKGQNWIRNKGTRSYNAEPMR